MTVRIRLFEEGDVIPGKDRNIRGEHRSTHFYKFVKHVCHHGCSKAEEPRDSGKFRCLERLDLWPMCAKGWNRSDGAAFSILRNNRAGPDCKVCARRIAAGLPPVMSAKHKTKWI